MAFKENALIYPIINLLSSPICCDKNVSLTHPTILIVMKTVAFLSQTRQFSNGEASKILSQVIEGIQTIVSVESIRPIDEIFSAICNIFDNLGSNNASMFVQRKRFAEALLVRFFPNYCD